MVLVWRSSTTPCIRLTWVRVSSAAINSNMKRYKHHQWYLFCSCSFYWGCCHYCDYFAGECAAWYIGIDRFSAAQGPFCTIQLFGTWPHQVQWCAAAYYNPFPANHVTAATDWTSLWFGLQVLIMVLSWSRHIKFGANGFCGTFARETETVRNKVLTFSFFHLLSVEPLFQ